ncbi:hypothetical protein NQ317_015010 [Molorchus minor]|uniref:Tyr recombinase domain-containing protein n=1 Tax=Molorchus minor TaxID=1323400 RepID=A0ABQ9K4F6_9CUCU|nr:hypothetical protein NQ317_015010 [Molorchus minor]
MTLRQERLCKVAKIENLQPAYPFKIILWSSKNGLGSFRNSRTSNIRRNIRRSDTLMPKCTMNNCESEEIVEAANIAISNLLPTKSRSLYDIAYNRFKKWCAEKNVQIGLILGIAGACRTDELVNLTVDDIEDVGSSLIVKIPNTKTKIPRIFVVTDVGNMLELFRKYLSLRPPHVKHKRLFLYYKAGKCSSQPVGKNTMGKIPSVVASYLKLPDVACYTGHCLRRSSATLLADAGVDITTIKRHAGWKSTTVAEGYVENSIENKTKIANQVLVGTTTSAITKTVNVSENSPSPSPKIHIQFSVQVYSLKFTGLM